MFIRKLQMPQRSMPTAEEFALWGAYELSFEELLEVNGGRHVIDDPSTDDVSDTIANGGHSPGGSSSSSDSGSSGGSSGGSSSAPPSSSPSEPVTGSDSDDTGGSTCDGWNNYWNGLTSGGSSGGGSSGSTGGSSGNSDSSGDSSSHDSSDDDYSSSDDSDSGYWGGDSSGRSGYHPPAQSEPVPKPSAGNNVPQAQREQGHDLPQKPETVVPALPEERKGIKGLIDKVTNIFFSNDGAKTIYTAGVSASGTVTMVSGAAGAGIYINPKNENLFNLSTKLLTSANPLAQTTGAVLMAANIEDIGGYAGTEAGAGAGISGSLAMTCGAFKSKEDAAGLYYAMGGSGGGAGLSGGGDMVFSMDGKPIGTQASFGPGVGLTSFEAHTRWGVTGVTSFINKSSATP